MKLLDFLSCRRLFPFLVTIGPGLSLDDLYPLFSLLCESEGLTSSVGYLKICWVLQFSLARHLCQLETLWSLFPSKGGERTMPWYEVSMQHLRYASEIFAFRTFDDLLHANMQSHAERRPRLRSAALLATLGFREGCDGNVTNAAFLVYKKH